MSMSRSLFLSGDLIRFIALNDLSQSAVAKGRIKIIATKNWSKGKSSFESELRTNFAKSEKCPKVLVLKRSRKSRSLRMKSFESTLYKVP